MHNYKSNPELPFIRKDWTGNKLDAKGRFVNHEFPFSTGLKDVWKWQTGPKPHKQAKKEDSWRPAVLHDTAFLQESADCIVWLGHAWFFIRVGGLNLLIDPVLYKIPMVKQLVPVPYAPSIFDRVDLILVSHDHRDHMDEKSIRSITALHPNAQIITGLNMTGTLRKWCNNPVIEMGWYQQWQHPSGKLKITYLPTRHWGRRYLNDTNLRLWGAFMLETPDKRIYFGSDSGYGSHFHELRDLFDPIDIALLGIGAFRPEWFMHQAHMSPWNAVKAFQDSGAKAILPMHYGTLDLSDEPISEPIRIIQQLQDEGKIGGTLLVRDIGATQRL